MKYGENSFNEFCKEAGQRRIPFNVAKPAGLARDMDLPDDLHALRKQSGANRTWRYLRSLDLADR